MLRFLRRHRAEPEPQEKKLQRHFQPEQVTSSGVPRGIHRCAVDPAVGLVAVVTKSGCVELFEYGRQKRVLLKRLGSETAFFSFLAGHRAILLVCAEKPGTSRLPEAYHLLDADGNKPCFTFHRPPHVERGRCFGLASPPGRKTSLLMGTSKNTINSLSWDYIWPSSMAVDPWLDFADRLHDGAPGMESIHASADFVVCCFGGTLALLISSDSKEVLREITFKFDVEAVRLNPHRREVVFASASVVCSLRLDALELTSVGLKRKGLGRLQHYEVLDTKMGALVVALGGVSLDQFPDGQVVTLRRGDELVQFTFCDPVLQLEAVVAEDGLASSILVLSQHEFCAIDLLGEGFKPISSSFLQCVDYSNVSCIRVADFTPPDDFLQRHLPHSSSARSNIFNTDISPPPGPEPMVLTGHQNGDVALWAGAADGLHRLCTFESREFVQMDEAPRDEEVVECDIHGAREPSTDDWVCVKGPDGEDLTHASADPEDRTLLPLSRIGERAEQKRLEKLGRYDDRCEEDGLTVEALAATQTAKGRLLALGLNAGLVLTVPLEAAEEEEAEDSAFCLSLLHCSLSTPASAQNSAVRVAARLIDRAGRRVRPLKTALLVTPQTPIRALAVSAGSGLVAVGCSTGIVVFEPLAGALIFHRNFLSAEDTSFVIAEEKPLTRLKSMKQSVRKTFRRKKTSSTDARRPQEREVEFRNTAVPTVNGFRCVQFYEPAADRQFLLAGTGRGVVFLFGVNAENCVLFKEIRLAHASPVVGISFHRTDSAAKAFVFTEEQVRCFVLDAMRPSKQSYKVTAKHGVKVRRAAVVHVPNTDFSFLALACNDGAVLAFSLLDRKPFLSQPFTEQNDSFGSRLVDVGSQGLLAFVTDGGRQLSISNLIRNR